MQTITYGMDINNNVLLSTTGNYIQYLVINHMEKNVKKNAYICITESRYCLEEMNTTLYVTYIQENTFLEKESSKSNTCGRVFCRDRHCWRLCSAS